MISPTTKRNAAGKMIPLATTIIALVVVIIIIIIIITAEEAPFTEASPG